MRKNDDGLKEIINLLPEKTKMVEIGSYQGESTEIFAKSKKIKIIHAVDPFEDGYDMVHHLAYQCAMSVVEEAFNQRISNYKSVIKHKMKSEDAVKLFADESLDFIYIDGNHFYEFVKKDIQMWFPKIKINGWIAGHDFQIKEVVNAVQHTLGVPDFVFQDFSWIFQKNNKLKLKK
ncbi:MAG: class I SAM-dependent methyltransferase [Parachlamydiales bacterium]